MTELIAILAIEIVRVFFYFKSFSDEARRVMRGRSENLGLVKTNEVFGVVGMFNNSRFVKVVMIGVSNMVFKSDLDRFINL